MECHNQEVNVTDIYLISNKSLTKFARYGFVTGSLLVNRWLFDSPALPDLISVCLFFT